MFQCFVLSLLNTYALFLYSQLFSKKRFELILRALRFDDAETRQERVATNKFAHIQEVWDTLMEKCRNNWVPGPVVTVDEHFARFRGRCPFLMFLPLKPGKYGIKIFMVCDADKLYCINGFPYLGQGTVDDADLPQGNNNNIY